MKTENTAENAPYFQQPQQPINASSEPWVQQSQQPMNAPPEAWQQVPHPQVENQNFVHQSMIYQSPPQQDFEPSVKLQPVNNNSTLDSSLQSWESGSLNITQPAQLPWTYSSPQYCNPATNPNDFPSTTAPANVPWNFSSVCTSESATYNNTQSSFLSNDSNLMNGAVNPQNNISQSNITAEHKDKISNNVPDLDSASNSRDLVLDAECGSSSLSAFFQNSDQNNSASNSECGGTSTPDVKNIVDSSNIEENIAQLQIDSEKSSAPTEDDQEVQNREDTDDSGNQETSFIQEENENVHMEEKEIVPSNSDSSVNFVEGECHVYLSIFYILTSTIFILFCHY